ncbi:MAG: hypothetical protein ABIY48_02095 [Acidimicrobiales bacterium]
MPSSATPPPRTATRTRENGELTHTFDDTGTLEIGCHQAGHYARGMKLTITVT